MSHITWSKGNISFVAQKPLQSVEGCAVPRLFGSHADADADGQSRTEFGSCERHGGIVLTLPGVISRQRLVRKEESKRRGGYKNHSRAVCGLPQGEILLFAILPRIRVVVIVLFFLMMLVFTEALEQFIIRGRQAV